MCGAIVVAGSGEGAAPAHRAAASLSRLRRLAAECVATHARRAVAAGRNGGSRPASFWIPVRIFDGVAGGITGVVLWVRTSIDKLLG